MVGLIFRPATPADLPAIVALLAEDTLGEKREDASEPLDPRYHAAFDAMAADPNQRALVGEEAGRVVAYLQLTIIPGLAFRGLTRALIESVRVSSDRRGDGIGAALIAHAVDLARSAGCGMVQLTSANEREAAHRFYLRLGFSQSHAGFKLRL